MYLSTIFGLSQASELARRFQSIKLDAVYTSTLIRAVQTARIILDDNKSLPLTKLRDLEEMSFGIYEGRSWSPELAEVFNLMKSQWSQGNYDYRIEGGETNPGSGSARQKGSQLHCK